MYIAKNLQYLRKRDKITQEDLAEKLNVSRQSVSKWETGEAYPETDKLIAICDLFDVSLDGLMRSDLTGDGKKSDGAPEKKDIITDETPRQDEDYNSKARPSVDYDTYIDVIKRFSCAISTGVMLILFGVAACLALCGGSFALTGSAAELMSIMGAVAVILFVAGAVFLFVLFGQRFDKFKRENPIISEPKEQQEPKSYSAKMAGAISGILVDVVFLIVMTALIETGIIKTVNSDMAVCFVVSAFMAVLAVLICALVRIGMRMGMTKVSEYNKMVQREQHPTQTEKIAGTVSGVIMMSATVVFLLLGFLGGYWHPGWIVFPVGGIICGIIHTIFNAKNK